MGDNQRQDPYCADYDSHQLVHIPNCVFVPNAWHQCCTGSCQHPDWLRASDIISKCGVGLLIYQITYAKSNKEALLASEIVCASSLLTTSREVFLLHLQSVV